ncbi:MAG: CHAT domain-containing protein [Chitinophagales bacterium]
MKRVLLTIFSTCLLIFLFPQEKESTPKDYITDYSKAEKLFEKAQRLSDKADIDNKTQELQDQLYSEALINFMIAATKANLAKNDSLNFHTFIKIGLINHYFDSVAAAKENYLKAIDLKPKLSNTEDSFLFKPYLFLGGILYDEHKFDSALYYYQKAEFIQNSYPVILEESQRLYNKLGAMNYETGNYRLAKTYFEKALSSLSRLQPSRTSLMINYRINIASILVKLLQYDEAKKIYESILPYKIYENETWHNLGIIDNHEEKFKEAIEDFKKVSYPASNKNVDLNYNLAVAFSNLNQNDSATVYLQKAILENKKYNNDQKNTPYGLVLKFSGDKKNDVGEYAGALNYYQRAIIQFDISYNDSNIYKNPVQFSGIFSYINLFNTLTSKAGAFKRLYGTNKEIKNLEASLDAYRSAFRLVDYVEKTYESDESRIFLTQIKYAEHGKPIDLCLELYELTKEQNYLEEAYFFDQRNKASILSLNLQLQQIGRQGTELSELTQKESSLKSAITRLSLNAAQLSDSKQLFRVNNDISDLEIQLAGIQQILNSNPKYSQLQPADQIPAVSTLQNKILDNHTALISYHLSEKDLLIFTITTKGLNYYKQAINENFYNNIRSYLKDLHEVSDEEEYRGDTLSKYLFHILIRPVLPIALNCKRLIIIPDDELNYLPFESLKDENNRYLVESFSVQYQYSTALLNIKSENKHIPENKILAFAPFIDNEFQNRYQVLRYSKDEVVNLNGQVFLGKDATKQQFLASANHYEMIHLATHATVNDSLPLQSFISFYPTRTDSTYRLYAQEIYDLRLDSTQLVILSACETGAGQLVRGEGLMSLSRAFAYAGCPNIVTSLWKAEDKTTAFITKRLHFYLEKKYSNDEALQNAKLDLLSSNEIEPRFKTPNYWSHLVFIGNYKPGKSSPYLWWIIGAIIVITAFFLFLKRKVPQKAGPSSS